MSGPAESSLKTDKQKCKNIFCSLSGSGDIREKRKVEKQGVRVFLLSTVGRALAGLKIKNFTAA